MSQLKNSTFLVSGVIISNALAYAFHMIAGRALGPSEYGVFGALMAFFQIGLILMTPINLAITKFASEYLTTNNYSKVAALKKTFQKHVLSFSIIQLFIVIIFSKPIASYLKIEEPGLIILVGIMNTFTLLMPINIGLLQAMKKYKALGLNNILEAFSRIMLLGIFLYLDLKATGAMAAFGVAYLIAYLIAIPYIKLPNHPKRDEQLHIGRVYRFALYVIILFSLTNLLLYAPSMVIKHYYSNEFTGYWTAALNISRIILVVAGAIGTVMYSEVVGENDLIKKRYVLKRALFLILIASIVAALILWVIARPLIIALYGNAFINAAPILQFMGFAMIPISIIQLLASYKLANIQMSVGS
jgi:O-antigen/teichoic acid export membrane protein